MAGKVHGFGAKVAGGVGGIVKTDELVKCDESLWENENIMGRLWAIDQDSATAAVYFRSAVRRRMGFDSSFGRLRSFADSVFCGRVGEEPPVRSVSGASFVNAFEKRYAGRLSASQILHPDFFLDGLNASNAENDASGISTHDKLELQLLLAETYAVDAGASSLFGLEGPDSLCELATPTVRVGGSGDSLGKSSVVARGDECSTRQLPVAATDAIGVGVTGSSAVEYQDLHGRAVSFSQLRMPSHYPPDGASGAAHVPPASDAMVTEMVRDGITCRDTDGDVFGPMFGVASSLVTAGATMLTAIPTMKAVGGLSPLVDATGSMQRIVDLTRLPLSFMEVGCAAFAAEVENVIVVIPFDKVLALGVPDDAWNEWVGITASSLVAPYCASGCFVKPVFCTGNEMVLSLVYSTRKSIAGIHADLHVAGAFPWTFGMGLDDDQQCCDQARVPARFRNGFLGDVNRLMSKAVGEAAVVDALRGVPFLSITPTTEGLCYLHMYEFQYWCGLALQHGWYPGVAFLDPSVGLIVGKPLWYGMMRGYLHIDKAEFPGATSMVVGDNAILAVSRRVGASSDVVLGDFHSQ